uniref:Uncharacterized protein n=1 Tax=Anguilla anguilla TaxID=7936 RepID=A0A0E9U0E1_ANGAN
MLCYLATSCSSASPKCIQYHCFTTRCTNWSN